MRRKTYGKINLLRILIMVTLVLSICWINGHSPARAYQISVNVIYGGGVSDPYPDQYQYTVSGEGDEEAYDFHLDFLPLDDYQSVDLPTGWLFAQDSNGVHWYNASLDNPISEQNPLTFSLSLEDAQYALTADAYISSDGQAERDPAQAALAEATSVPANLVWFFAGGGGGGGGGGQPPAPQTKVQITKSIITPNYWQIDTKGTIIYMDAQGNLKQGIWTLSSIADDRDNDGKWDYSWVLKNIPGKPGGLPFGNLIDYNDTFAKGYPEDFAKVIAAAGNNRLAQDVWPQANPGGFDGLIKPGNPLTPGAQARVLLFAAPPPMLGQYWTRWNPQGDKPAPYAVPTPEPGTYLLLGSGLLFLKIVKRRKKAIAMLRRITIAIALFVSLLSIFSTKGDIYAGTIEIAAIEDKGQVVTLIGHNEFKSSMTVTLHWPDWGELSGTYWRGNREVFVIDEIITEHFYNVYPATIEIPQPIDLQQLVTIPFFMATGLSPSQLGPLPQGGSVTAAEMMDGYGRWHSGTIASFWDVFTELPTSGPNAENYTWNLGGFIEPQGNFYLAQVTMTAEAFAAPEPATLAMMLTGALAWSSVRRKLKT